MNTTNRRLNILSIDDDPGCQKAVTRFMNVIGGHSVDTAYTGAEGLRKAAQTRPDLILLDLVLPDMDGFHVMERLARNSRTKSIPVIMLTGAELTQADKSNLSLKPNFLRLEEKPCSFMTLLGSINTIIGAAGGQDKLMPGDSEAGTTCAY